MFFFWDRFLGSSKRLKFNIKKFFTRSKYIFDKKVVFKNLESRGNSRRKHILTTKTYSTAITWLNNHAFELFVQEIPCIERLI